jgi:hypothetical protein
MPPGTTVIALCDVPDVTTDAFIREPAGREAPGR